ncbi:hypothetical protein [Azospirillum argentinense]|uniref:hypothetical protein n=1 Tax=Azospirillum argentinense TaxID=2970906 RepID=UPI0032DF39C7
MSAPPSPGWTARNLQGGWTIRRRIIVATLLFNAACVVHSMVWQTSEAIAGTVITNAFLMAGGVIGSYVFGAVWDDKGKRGEP